mgnify:CR=1 FL=1
MDVTHSALAIVILINSALVICQRINRAYESVHVLHA